MNEFNFNDYNRAQAYLNNFQQDYAADDTVPSVITMTSLDLPDYYDRFAYDFAGSYVNRHKDRAVVGGRRRSRKQRRQRQRRSRQQRQRRSSRK